MGQEFKEGKEDRPGSKGEKEERRLVYDSRKRMGQEFKEGREDRPGAKGGERGKKISL